MALFIFVLILICLILVHEFGHFVVAKLSGMRVEEFGIGFPPRLFGIRRGDTVYSFNALLLGGFVKIFGETEKDTSATDQRSFTDKPWYVQGLVVIAGIFCNLLVAWLLLSVAYLVGIPSDGASTAFGTPQQIHTTVMSVLPNSPAAKVGILAGDQVVEVETGTTALPLNANATAVQQFIASHQSESLVLSLVRHGVPKTVLATPADGIVPGTRVIGIELEDVGVVQLPFFSALVQSSILSAHLIASTAEGLASFFFDLVRGAANFSQVAGPIGIAGIGASAVAEGIGSTLLLTALISINLALINILPVPGLDGGRLALLLVERIRGKAFPESLVSRFSLIGFVLLIVLLLVVSYHDVLHLLNR